MEEYDKQFPLDEDMYDMYYYDDKFPGAGEELEEEDFDEDDVLFFDNNELANRIWDEND